MNPTLLKTGDILHCNKKGLLNKVFSYFTKSAFTHSAMFIDIYGQYYVATVIDNKLRLMSWYKFSKTYNYIAFRNSNPIDKIEIAKRILTKVESRAFNFQNLLLKPWKFWFKKVKVKTLIDKPYCSEIIGWVYGYEKEYKITPDDLYLWTVRSKFKEIK